MRRVVGEPGAAVGCDGKADWLDRLDADGQELDMPSRSRPITSPRSMVNHTLPSGPVAIAVGITEASRTGYSTKCPEGPPLPMSNRKTMPAPMHRNSASERQPRGAAAAIADVATWCS